MDGVLRTDRYQAKDGTTKYATYIDARRGTFRAIASFPKPDPALKPDETKKAENAAPPAEPNFDDLPF